MAKELDTTSRTSGPAQKIIWVVNILMPEAARAMGLPEPVVGGWLTAYRTSLRRYCPELQVHVVSPYTGAEFRTVEVGDDRHYLFPEQSDSTQRRAYFRQIIHEVQPDVVHLHGSECPHSWDFLSEADPLHAVLSIQGLVSVCAPYYYGGMTPSEVRHYTTMRDVLKRDTLGLNQQRFVQRGRIEQALIGRVAHIIGRTEWDRAHSRALHPGAHYHHCEEALRPEFYDRQWRRESCFETPTLFVSQASYPIKGLHKLLEVLPLVLRTVPNLQVHIAGNNLMAAPAYKRTTYGNYLLQRARQLGVMQHLHFLGPLSGAQMIEQYLGARLFVSPSVIENSSNSVCEAQLLGTPVVASNVGGMADLIAHRHTGMLYRFEETAMLADYIVELLSDDALCTRISDAERSKALRRHDYESIAHRLVEIYNTIAHD